MAGDPSIKIDYIGGNCPVQAEGRIDGKPFYFRARGCSWSIGIGGDPVMLPEWYATDDYGDGPYDAGYMPVYDALSFIAAAMKEYAEGMEE